LPPHPPPIALVDPPVLARRNNRQGPVWLWYRPTIT